MLLEIDRLSFPVPLEATRHLRAPGVQLRHQSVGKNRRHTKLIESALET